MHRVRRVLYAISLSVLTLVLPASTYAGGGVGGGGVGGGGFGGLVIMVDHMTPPGHTYSFLDYFPRTAWVHQGDVVTFVWANNANAIHTVSFLPRGVPVTDANVNAYFPGALNGAPDDDNPKQFVFPLKVNQAQGCGNSAYFPGTAPCNIDGTRPMSSGLQVPAVQKGQSAPTTSMARWVVRFTGAPGDYHWLCLIHGGMMNGTVHVLAPGAPIPSLAAQAQMAAQQYQWGSGNAIQHEAQDAAHIPPPTTKGGHATWNVLAGDQYGRVEIDDFIPSLANVKAGDSVNWLPGGFHTITSTTYNQPALGGQCDIGPRDVPFSGYAGCNFELTFGPGAAPSGPSGQAWTGGPMNSGLIVVPQPHAWSVSVPKAGTYQYHCLIHANMMGTITVR